MATVVKVEEDDNRRFRITPIQQMMSSCSGAILTAFLVTPLDVVKVRLQTQQKALLSNKCFVYCNGLVDQLCHGANCQLNVWVKRQGHFTSTIDVFHKIVRTEGVSSLWSGLPPTLIMAVPSAIVYFVTYEQLRVRMVDLYHQSKSGRVEDPLYIPLVAGGLARLWAVTVVNPLELIRTKMQSKRLSYKELSRACGDLHNARGWTGFWMGYFPSLARDVPFSAIYFGCYEGQKKLAGYGSQEKETPILFSFAAGAVAGSVAGALTLPLMLSKLTNKLKWGKQISNSKQAKVAPRERNNQKNISANRNPRAFYRARTQDN
ncbi:Solute carrier family 25 member 40 [Orchesella cincta]|uniref:Solute carrier family 25 member 40 n=1 Tax=Orchesella cincta TaxID=48709 RepID=A0A1D2MD08_ORCCI|nr:Solute carrier family 25 member 40 [Orchesella cincta]